MARYGLNDPLLDGRRAGVIGINREAWVWLFLRVVLVPAVGFEGACAIVEQLQLEREDHG